MTKITNYTSSLIEKGKSYIDNMTTIIMMINKGMIVMKIIIVTIKMDKNATIVSNLDIMRIYIHSF